MTGNGDSTEFGRVLVSVATILFLEVPAVLFDKLRDFAIFHSGSPRVEKTKASIGGGLMMQSFSPLSGLTEAKPNFA